MNILVMEIFKIRQPDALYYDIIFLQGRIAS